MANQQKGLLRFVYMFVGFVSVPVRLSAITERLLSRVVVICVTLLSPFRLFPIPVDL